MLQPGITHETHRVVTKAEAIHFLGPDVTPALSTPSMIMLLEITARDAVLPQMLLGAARPPLADLAVMLGAVILVGIATGFIAVRATLRAPLVGALRGE